MNKLTLRRLFGGMLTLSLALSALPAAALADQADGLCCHHPAHTDGCRQPEGGDCAFGQAGCAQCMTLGDLIPIIGTDVTMEGSIFPYTGQEVCPKVTVTVGGQTLEEGTHYELSYRDNLAAGTASVTVTGLEEGGYTGTVTLPFTIEAPGYTLVEIKGTDVTVSGTKFPYTGEAIEPEVTVTVEGRNLTEGTDYSVTYANNIQPGTGTVTVRGIATASMTLGYTGEVTLEFTVTEPAQTPEEEEKPEEPTQPEEDEKPEESAPEEETKPVTYRITRGNKATWYMGSGKTLSFTADGSRKDFTGISVNGKRLDKQHYTAADDTTVTLNTGYLNRLTVGSYRLTIHFEDGTAEGTFTVSNRLDTTNPGTGDSITAWLLTAAVSLSALACAAFVFSRKAI